MIIQFYFNTQRPPNRFIKHNHFTNSICDLKEILLLFLADRVFTYQLHRAYFFVTHCLLKYKNIERKRIVNFNISLLFVLLSSVSPTLVIYMFTAFCSEALNVECLGHRNSIGDRISKQNISLLLQNSITSVIYFNHCAISKLLLIIL